MDFIFSQRSIYFSHNFQVTCVSVVVFPIGFLMLLVAFYFLFEHIGYQFLNVDLLIMSFFLVSVS